MCYLFLFPFPGASHPLTEARMQAILQAAHCILLYRFDHLHVIDQTGCESHVCRREELITLDAQEFSNALIEALACRCEP